MLAAFFMQDGGSRSVDGDSVYLIRKMQREDVSKRSCKRNYPRSALIRMSRLSPGRLLPACLNAALYGDHFCTVSALHSIVPVLYCIINSRLLWLLIKIINTF